MWAAFFAKTFLTDGVPNPHAATSFFFYHTHCSWSMGVLSWFQRGVGICMEACNDVGSFFAKTFLTDGVPNQHAATSFFFTTHIVLGRWESSIGSKGVLVSAWRRATM